MLVKGKIKKDVYKKLIEYASSKSDAVMFVSKKIGFTEKQKTVLDKNMHVMKNNLKDFFLYSRNGCRWIFSECLPYSNCDPIEFDKMFEIMFFIPQGKVLDYLFSNDNLYNWLNPNYPEDISFFKDGYCWLNSITHEELCFIECESVEEYRFLKSIGIKFADKKLCITPKEKMYFEDYFNN